MISPNYALFDAWNWKNSDLTVNNKTTPSTKKTTRAPKNTPSPSMHHVSSITHRSSNIYDDDKDILPPRE